MRLLVTGGSGFIGRNLLASLPREQEVVALYCHAPDFPAFLAARGLDHVIPVRVDLTRPDAGSALARWPEFDAGVHLAANSDPAVSVQRPAFDLEHNTLGLVRLLEAVRVGHLVCFSSGAVYEGLQGPVSPASVLHSSLPYAISKLAAERYVDFFRSRGRVGSAYVVRFFGAYGPWEPRRKIYTHLVRQFGILRDPRFVLRGDGRNLIDAMYVDDAVRAIRLMLGRPGENRTLDMCTGAPLTLRTLVERAAGCFGLAPEISTEGAVPEYIEFRSTDDTLAREFGFTPAVPLEEGLRHLHRHLEGQA